MACSRPVGDDGRSRLVRPCVHCWDRGARGSCRARRCGGADPRARLPTHSSACFATPMPESSVRAGDPPCSDAFTNDRPQRPQPGPHRPWRFVIWAGLANAASPPRRNRPRQPGHAPRARANRTPHRYEPSAIARVAHVCPKPATRSPLLAAMRQLGTTLSRRRRSGRLAGDVSPGCLSISAYGIRPRDPETWTDPRFPRATSTANPPASAACDLSGAALKTSIGFLRPPRSGRPSDVRKQAEKRLRSGVQPHMTADEGNAESNFSSR